ncbi:MAG: caspase family protein, partial [Cyanobacteria bacterium J06558_2]
MADQAITVKKLQLGTAKLWIVLVGVNRYLDSKIRNLQYCANDCQELAGVLGIATQQFQEAEIVALYDDGDIYPELAAVENSIRKFRSAKAEDTVLFYFSGHGYLDANNRPVLCVADTSLADLSNTSLTLDYLLKELTHCDAQRQLVWLDACQEDGQTDGNKKANPAAQLNAVLEEQSRRSYNFYAMLSCNKHQRSWEIKELQHGVFTYCLIEGLKGKAANSKNIIDADGLFYYVERTSQRIIKDLKNPLVRDISAKGMNFPPKKAYQLPANAAQSPQRIVKGGGELFFIIGIATPLKNRKALIIDKLATSIDSIRLCKLLQAKGSFEVEYRYLWQKQRWNLQQYLAKYLESSNDQTVLLYLAGKIEVNASGLYELLLDEGHRLDLHWLSRVIKTSTIKELVLIADLEATRETIPSLKEILKLKDEQPFCIITAYNSEPPNKKFLREVVKLLDDAGESDIEYRVTDLISDLQKWSKSQTEIKVKGWWGTVGIIDILSVAVQRSDNEIFTIDVCPYKSLSAFTQDDAYFFHGRGNLINRILANLRTQSFLAVVGASGSGKSSVVRAGVLPRLAAEGLTLSQSRQSQICKTWVMLPGNNPLKALAQALTPDSSLLLKGLSNAGVDHFMAWLRQQPQSISVLVIDQFEELFTLTDDQERDNFIKLIASAIAQAGDIFKVIITLRADFYDRFLRMDKIASLLEKNEALVSVNSSRLQDEQYRDIIAQPARQVGLEVESGLMAVLLEELKAGSLPLLQYALEELWHYSEDGRLTLDNYKQHIGQLGQFLSDKAEATYNNFNELQKECAKFIFLRLVFLANKKDESKQDTRRRLLKSDLIVPRCKVSSKTSLYL